MLEHVLPVMLAQTRVPCEWNHHMGGWGWPMMGVGMLLWSAVLIFIGWTIASAMRDRGGLGGRESPHDILKKRYARGEISREEYERMRKELQ
jgi:putative membrane protein